MLPDPQVRAAGAGIGAVQVLAQRTQAFSGRAARHDSGGQPSWRKAEIKPGRHPEALAGGPGRTHGPMLNSASVSKDGRDAWTRGHPSRRAQGRAPRDEVGYIFQNLLGG